MNYANSHFLSPSSAQSENSTLSSARRKQPFPKQWWMIMSCSARWCENDTRSPVGNDLEGPRHRFHEIVNSKIVKCLIYTVNYCYFVCEWDIIYLLYKWSTFVVLFNVSRLQNKHCMHVSYTPGLLVLLFWCVFLIKHHLFHNDTLYYVPQWLRSIRATKPGSS